eukprot:175484-Prymnesium_polylepis.3
MELPTLSTSRERGESVNSWNRSAAPRSPDLLHRGRRLWNEDASARCVTVPAGRRRGADAAQPNGVRFPGACAQHDRSGLRSRGDRVAADYRRDRGRRHGSGGRGAAAVRQGGGGGGRPGGDAGEAGDEHQRAAQGVWRDCAALPLFRVVDDDRRLLDGALACGARKPRVNPAASGRAAAARSAGRRPRPRRHHPRAGGGVGPASAGAHRRRHSDCLGEGEELRGCARREPGPATRTHTRGPVRAAGT